MKVGDLITTYHKGIWRLVSIQEMPGTVLAHYELVYRISADYVLISAKKSQKECCDLSYCKPVKELVEKINSFALQLNTL